MKNLWFIGLFIISVTLIGCSDKEKDNKAKETLVKETDSKTLAQEKDGNRNNIKGTTQTGAIITKADAAFESKVQKGDVVLLTINGEPEAFKFDGGSKITAMKLPDGNLYQVKEDGDRTMINVPGKGEMGIIMLNDKFYLFDDDNQAYEVKFSNKQLFAEKTELTDVILSRK
jgi:hypothetical protein